MKTIGAYLVAALALAVLGGVALAVGRLEHRIAGADAALVSLGFVESARAYDELEHSRIRTLLPWIGGDALTRMRASRAAVRYWGGDYDALLSLARGQTAGGTPTRSCCSSPQMRRTAWGSSARPTVQP